MIRMAHKISMIGTFYLSVNLEQKILFRRILRSDLMNQGKL
jgi:hypothetical protein